MIAGKALVLGLGWAVLFPQADWQTHQLGRICKPERIHKHSIWHLCNATERLAAWCICRNAKCQLSDFVNQGSSGGLWWLVV